MVCKQIFQGREESHKYIWLLKVIITMLFLVHGFCQAVYDVVEDGRLFTDFDLNIKGMTQISALSRIIVGAIAAELDGTASRLCENYQ